MMKRIFTTAVLLSIIPLSSAFAVTTQVPEPSTLLLLGCTIAGLGLFLFWKSRKKKVS